MVNQKPQEATSAVSFTIGELVKVFHNCQYFSGTNRLKVSVTIPSSGITFKQ
jgi:hypothetical protein